MKPNVYAIPLVSSNPIACKWRQLGDESTPVESVVAYVYEHVVVEFLDLKTQFLEPASKYGAYNRVSDSLVSKETSKQPLKSIVITKEQMDIYITT